MTNGIRNAAAALVFVTNRIRNGAAALVFLCCLVTFTSAFNLPNRSPGPSPRIATSSTTATAGQERITLNFTDRVAYQRAIEEVYWRHRIWPKENPGPKPPLDEVMSQAQIEKKVEDYLRNSKALEDYWQRPITPDQLQAEMERMASHTRQPEVLRELFQALGNDPFVIAECLARPVLAERLVTEVYAHDQRIHGGLKRRAEAELKTHPSVRQMKQTSGMYTETEWIKSDPAKDGSASTDTKNGEAVKMNGSERQESIEKLAEEFGNTKTRDAWAQIRTGVLSPLREDEAYYYAVAVMKKGKDRLKLATIAWLKEPLRSWVTRAETQVPVTMAAVSASYTLPLISSSSVACTDDTWAPTSLTNAPAARSAHTAAWTGSEMIVWGGSNGTPLNTGGRYNPSTDTWTPTSIGVNTPAGRYSHTAVWTGSEMIVWGGRSGGVFLNTGGRYNPGTDSWTTTSSGANVPDARYVHTAVWTGTQMIVWGGLGTGFVYLNTGGRYNPSTDSWVATSTGANVPDARSGHTAVWTSSEMTVWGGDDGSYVNTGGRYNPTADSWTATSTTNAPDPREVPTAVWTGSEMIIWGGIGNSGFENTGGRYNPGTNSWTTIFSPLAGRAGPTSVWTGSQMIVWGGDFRDNFGADHYVNTGGRYNPSTNSWTLTSTTGAPDARTVHTAVWTGNQMIVWGGADNTNRFNTGGRYCAASGPTPPPAPIANPATYIASNSFTANWSSVSGATGYRLDMATNSSFSTYVTGYQNLSVGNATSRSVTGLNASTAYYYRVRAYNGAGTSGNSNIVNVTTLSTTGPPVVITNPATLVASFSATLNGSVDPHGLTTNVYFQYGTTTSYGLTTPVQSKNGNTYQNVAANISGLSASTTYHFRMVAVNSAGTRYGADRTFTTLSATGPPVVITNPATLIASFSATLNGAADPHGLTTNVYFQYGTTTSYGLTTATQSKTGNTYQNVAANISSLAASTTYHFRVVATNSAGTKYGSDRTFTTLSAAGPPVVITNSATNVASSSATLNGSVDPHGLTTTLYFQYGTTTSYGHTTASQSKTGNTYQNVAANISGLTASTTYHFRIVSTNSAGTVYGSDKTLTTL